MMNMPTMKNKTPKAICQLWCTAGHTIQMDERAKAAPARWVTVLARSDLMGKPRIIAGKGTVFRLKFKV